MALMELQTLGFGFEYVDLVGYFKTVNLTKSRYTCYYSNLSLSD